MAAEKLRETYTEMVIRMDEKLAAIVKQLEDGFLENKEFRVETLVSIKELTLHVNHENELMDVRIKYVEKCEVERKAAEKQTKKIVTAGLTILGVVATIISILHYIGFL